MSKAPTPTSGEAVSAAKIDRRKLMKGAAIAATATVVGTSASAGVSETSELPELIEAHQKLHIALNAALGRLDAAEEHYERERNPNRLMLVRGHRHWLEVQNESAWPWWKLREHAREEIARHYATWRGSIPQVLSDGLMSEARKELDLAQRAAYRRLVKVIEHIKQEQKALGYLDAVEEEEAISSAYREAEMAVLSYRCETVAECRMKADYIKSNSTLYESACMAPECFDAFLSSFLSVEA